MKPWIGAKCGCVCVCIWIGDTPKAWLHNVILSWQQVATTWYTFIVWFFIVMLCFSIYMVYHDLSFSLYWEWSQRRHSYQLWYAWTPRRVHSPNKGFGIRETILHVKIILSKRYMYIHTVTLHSMGDVLVHLVLSMYICLDDQYLWLGTSVFLHPLFIV